MSFTGLDYGVLFAYLVFVTAFGSLMGRRQRTAKDYFLGGRSLPWGAVAFSIVAAETSTLTVISVPGLAYLSNMNFLQLAFGYLVGRTIISFVLLPAYAKGDLTTAYELLGQRFGGRLRNFVTLVFQFTRLLADGVRLFATAIPVAIITGWSYPTAIVIIGVVTVIYTYFGGIKAVGWLDVLQMSIYVGGALLAGAMILHYLPEGWHSVVAAAAPQHKFSIFYLGLDKGFKEFFSINYTLFSGLIGGAFLSMASHGTDQLIVQKLFSCRNLRSSQKALISSGVLVILQFTIFLVLGIMLYAYYHGAQMRSDEVYPRFIVEGLPPGLSGLIIAGIFAAAISTLSASLNSLSSTTMNDLFKPRFGKNLTPGRELFLSRMFTVLWSLVFILGAMFFKDRNNPVVELGLGIASFTYGGMLGTFFLGIRKRKNVAEDDALVSIWSAIFLMIWVIGQSGWILAGMTAVSLLAGGYVLLRLKTGFHRIALTAFAAAGLLLIALVPSPRIAWPWYVFIGTLLTYALGNLMAFLRQKFVT